MPVTKPHRRTKPADSTEPPVTGTTTARTTDIRSIAYEVQDKEDIQIVIETSRKARAYVRYSATSRQVIVDIPNSRLNLDDDRQKDQDIKHPLVEGLSAATVQSSPRLPPLTRITIDAPKIVSTAVESDNNQIVIDITVPKSSRRSNSTPSSKLNAIIVVDPGHGGALTGAAAGVRGLRVYEKNITLGIASKLRTALEARGTRVIMTRESDVNVPLEERPQIANEIGANVFVSIHNDSWGKANSITGTTVYYHGNSSESRRLARCVEQELADVSGMRDRGAISDTNVYPEGFCVLRDTEMPAVLCELGYINNTSDRTKLLRPAYQRRVAEAICRGIRNYASGERSTARRRARKQAASA
jgi:N-acetylmuramoyl-L-alanine amidase